MLRRPIDEIRAAQRQHGAACRAIDPKADATVGAEYRPPHPKPEYGYIRLVKAVDHELFEIDARRNAHVVVRECRRAFEFGAPDEIGAFNVILFLEPEFLQARKSDGKSSPWLK